MAAKLSTSALARALLNKDPSGAVSLCWATVAASSPVTVRLAGSDAPIPVTANAAGALSVGERVLCAWQGAALTILSAPQTAVVTTSNAGKVPGIDSALSALTGRVNEIAPKAGGGWSSWSPTLSTNGAALSIGTGTLTGHYQHVGWTCNWQLQLARSTSTNVGDGTYVFTLPVPASNWWEVTGAGYCSRGDLPLTVLGVGNGSIGALTPTGRLSTTNPGNWASGDRIVLAGTYRTAVRGL